MVELIYELLLDAGRWEERLSKQGRGGGVAPGVEGKARMNT